MVWNKLSLEAKTKQNKTKQKKHLIKLKKEIDKKFDYPKLICVYANGKICDFEIFNQRRFNQKHLLCRYFNKGCNKRTKL